MINISDLNWNKPPTLGEKYDMMLDLQEKKKHRNVSTKHEDEVDKYLKELEKDGWHTLKLRRKIPDGIAVKNGKLFAVEVVGHDCIPTPKNDRIKREKTATYHMFDGLHYKNFLRK